jgi:hypothetical protein
VLAVRAVFFGAMTFALGLIQAPSAASTQVRIRATSSIETSLLPRARGFELGGRLADETGRPLGDCTLSLELRREEPTSDPERCGGPGTPDPLERRSPGGGFALKTDAEGRFCLSFPLASRGATVRIGYAGDALHEPASPVSLVLSPEKTSLDLRFVPEPKVLELGRRMQTLWVAARLEPGPRATAPLPVELLLLVPGQPVRPLANAVLGARERVSLDFDSSRLGPPGMATLLLRSPGSDSILPVERRVLVERAVRVALSLSGPVSLGAMRDRVEIDVSASSAVGAVPSGSVEALVENVSVGIAPVRSGTARLVASIDAGYGRAMSIALRYLPEAPGWNPGDPLVVSVPAKLPSPWRGTFWAFGVLAICAWMLRTWRRPPRRVLPGETRGARGQPALELVEAGPPESGWRGVVRDAHEGRGLPGANVRIVVPSFAANGPAASATADQQGRFTLAHMPLAVEGTRLVAESRWHTTLTRPVPPPGQLVINLVSRRRALLERLVGWARRMGRPWWPGHHEPTPQELGRVAERQEAIEVASWAEAVERAAYGPGPVDESEEQRVLRLEPHGRPGGDASG